MARTNNHFSLNQPGLLLAIGLLAGLIGISMALRKAPDRKPNVLLILTDDQGYGDLSLHKNPYVETPNMDRIGREGAQFNRFYVSPLCAPSRASFLTGRYHMRTGVVSVSNGLEIMNSQEQTMGELFKENGYRTGCFGKWHNGEHLPNHPNGQGFEEFFGFCAGHWSNYFDTNLDHNGTMEPTKGYITDVLTDRAIDFIRQHKDQPFLCYVPYNAPHGPFQVPDGYFNKYKAKGLPDELAAIYGMVDNLDVNIGRLMQTLQTLNLDRETIVIFSTDNGPNGHRFNGGMKGIKGSVDEGGVRVPFFIRWPGKIKPRLIPGIAAHIDLMPTLRKMLGLRSAENPAYDGISLAQSILTDKGSIPTNRLIYTHVAQLDKELYPVPGAVRSPQYRWVKTRQETSLYDMTTDSVQAFNRIRQHADKARDFEQQYSRWFSEVSKGINLGDRPIPVGAGRKRQILPSHEARFSGNLRYKEGHGWAHDWLIKWIDRQDKIWWVVDNQATKDYDVAIQYTCPTTDVGSTVQLSATTGKLSAVLTTPFDPPLIKIADRKPRIEVYEKTAWGILPIGRIRLQKGRQNLTLSAPNIVGKEVAEIKGLILTEVDSK